MVEVEVSVPQLCLFVTPWTIAHQAPPSMGFYRQEYWSGLPHTPPGDRPSPGIEPRSLCIAGLFFTLWATRKTHGRSPLTILFSWLNISRSCWPGSLLEALAQPCSYNSLTRDAENLVVLKFMFISPKSKSDSWTVRRAQQVGHTQACDCWQSVPAWLVMFCLHCQPWSCGCHFC